MRNQRIPLYLSIIPSLLHLDFDVFPTTGYFILHRLSSSNMVSSAYLISLHVIGLLVEGSVSLGLHALSPRQIMLLSNASCTATFYTSFGFCVSSITLYRWVSGVSSPVAVLNTTSPEMPFHKNTRVHKNHTITIPTTLQGHPSSHLLSPHFHALSAEAFVPRGR